MNKETSLNEVAQHIPADMAMAMLKEPPAVQKLALNMIRDTIATMEEQGALLDPGSYSAVVYAISILAIVSARNIVTLAEVHKVLQKHEAQQ